MATPDLDILTFKYYKKVKYFKHDSHLYTLVKILTILLTHELS